MSATEKDIKNISAWAEIVIDMLWLVPRELHEDVLKLAIERAADQKRADENGLISWTPADTKNWLQSPGIKSYGAIMRLKALLIQVFVRNITNSHSAEDAAKLLFARQRYGTGSGELRDYVGDLVGNYDTDETGSVKRVAPKGRTGNKPRLSPLSPLK
jgi:hypothetical protein